MIRKLFLTAAAALLVAGIAAAQSSAPPTSPSQAPSTAPSQPTSPSATAPSQAPSTAQAPARQQMRSATGKVTAVSGDTFSIEIGQGDTKQTMQFTTDPSTSKSGDLKVGSTAKVEYHAGADGKNVASKVDVQS